MRASCFVEILLQLKAENIFDYYTKIYLSGENNKLIFAFIFCMVQSF